MTHRTRALALLALGVALLACGDDDDSTGTTGGGGGQGSAGKALDWDTFCSKEAAQFASCTQEYRGCANRCIASSKPDDTQLAVYQSCLLARSCDQLDSDDECYLTAALPDQAQVKPLIETCFDLQKECRDDDGSSLFKSSDDCVAVYSKFVDASLSAPVQACLAAHKDCASTRDCLQEPLGKLRAAWDEEQSCEDKLTAPK